MQEVQLVQEKVISKEVAISWIKSYINTHEEEEADSKKESVKY